MNCPGCGYDNAADALCCNLCSIVLRKEKPAAPPPAAAHSATAASPGEPARLDSVQAVADLLLAAFKAGGAQRFDEAERLMARLYAEVDRETCAQLLAAACEQWAKTSARPAPEIETVRMCMKMTAAAVSAGQLAQAAALGQSMMPSVAETTAEGFRVTLLLLGISGAAKRGVKLQAGPPPGTASAGAPPPGAANKPRF